MIALLLVATALLTLSGTAYGGLPSQDKAGRKKKLLIFGDSLADQSNLFALTNGKHPNVSIYYDGRFCNGPIWADYLNEGPGFQVTNYAISAATACGGQTDREKALLGPAAPMHMQIEDFLRGQPPAGPTNILGSSPPDVLALVAGTNDYLLAFLALNSMMNKAPSLPEALRAGRALLELPKQVTSCIIDNLRRILRTNRAQSKPLSVVIFGLPNLSFAVELPLVPQELKGPLRTVASAISRVHNDLLQAKIRGLQLQMGRRGVSLHFLDISASLDTAVRQADTLGVKVQDKPCVVYDYERVQEEALAILDNKSSSMLYNLLYPVSVCKNSAEYLFYDHVHPSTVVHKVLADEVAAILG